jgi:hypothetical protein
LGIGLPVVGVPLPVGIAFLVAAALVALHAYVPWFQRFRLQWPVTREPRAKAEIDPDTPRTVANRTVRIAELARDSAWLRGWTFEDCDIHGPALLVSSGPNMILEPVAEADVDAFFVVLPGGTFVAGAIAIDRCTFRRCRFSRVSFAGPQEAVDQWKTSIT